MTTNTTIDITEGTGRITADFELDREQLAGLLDRVRAHTGVQIAGLTYDEFFEQGELTLVLEGVEDPQAVLRLLEGSA